MEILRNFREYCSNVFWPEMESTRKVFGSGMVLREIKSYLSHRDLKRLRRVCRSLNHQLRDSFLRSSAINIFTMDRMRKFTSEINVDDKNLIIPEISLVITRYADCAIKIKPADFNSFFDKFSKQIQRLKFHLILNADKEENLWEWLGLLEDLENVEELSLGVRFYNLLRIQTGMPSIPVLKSLKKLTFSLVCGAEVPVITDLEQNQRLQKEAMSTWAEIIVKMAPEISALRFKDVDFWGHFQNDAFHRTFFQLLEREEIKGGSLPLPNLDGVGLMAARKSLFQLRRFTTFLKSLTVIWRKDWQNEESENWEHLNHLLEVHAPILQEFKLKFEPKLEDTNNSDKVIKILLRFPQIMPELKALHLQFIPPPNASSSHIQIQFEMNPINYEKTFPKIRELTLDDGKMFRGVVNEILLPKNAPKCQSVRKLAVNNPRRNLQKAFPNAVIVPAPQKAQFWQL